MSYRTNQVYSDRENFRESTAMIGSRHRHQIIEMQSEYKRKLKIRGEKVATNLSHDEFDKYMIMMGFTTDKTVYT